MPKIRLATFRKPAFALLASSLVLTLGACSMRTEDEMLQEKLDRAEAAAKKAVAAQQAAEEALDKIRMESRDNRPVDEERRDDLDAATAQSGQGQSETPNGPAPEA